MDDAADLIFFKSFARRHWKAIVPLIGAAIGIFIGIILVLLWFINYWGIGNPGMELLNTWSMATVINFLLNLILWEFLIIGIPIIAIGVVVFFQWWKKLPDEEREDLEKHGYGKRKNQKRAAYSGGGGLIGILVFVAFCIIVYINGNWSVPLANLSYFYVIYAWLTGLIWVLIIGGIPLTLIIFFWLRMEIKEEAK